MSIYAEEERARNAASMTYHDDPSNPPSCPAYEEHAISMGRNHATCPCEDAWEAHLKKEEVTR